MRAISERLDVALLLPRDSGFVEAPINELQSHQNILNQAHRDISLQECSYSEKYKSVTQMLMQCGRLIEMAYRDGVPLTDEDNAAIRGACEAAVNFGLKGHQIDLEINAGRMACRNGISSAS